MNKDAVRQFLKAHFDQEIASFPTTYNTETDKCGGCPPLSRFPLAASTNTWTSDERQHIRGCPYCQQTLAMQWQYRCPDESILEQYVQQIPNFIKAVELHLEKYDCSRCRRWIADQSRKEPAWLPGKFGFAGAFADAKIPFGFQCTIPDPPLRIALHTDSRGLLLVRVSTKDKRLVDRTVQFELRLKDEEIRSTNLVLRDAGEFLCSEEPDLGSFAILANRMDDFAVRARLLD